MSATAGVWGQGWADADDATLLEHVRGGDSEAYAELWRRHLPAAYGVAHRYRGRASAEDIVGEASLRVYDLIRAGKGPTSNFRSYFLTSVKTVAVDMARTGLRAVPTETEDLEVASGAVQAYDPGGRVDQQLVRTAFRRLPERDQQVLWHTAVEGTSPAVVATTMGMTANGVSVVALRARDTLRSRYLDAHADRAIQRAEDEECRWVLSQLGRYVRGKLPVRQRARVEQHLQDCPHAQAVLLELAEVNRGLPALMVPLIFVAGSATAAAWVGAAAVGASSPDAAKSPTSVVLTGSAAGKVAKAAALVAAGALGVGFVAAPPGGLDLFSPKDSQSQAAGSGGSSSGGPGSPGSVPGAGTPGTAGGGGPSPPTEAGSAASPAELPGSTGAFSNGSTGSAQRREGTSTTPATVSTPAVPVPPAPPSTTTSSTSATGTTTEGSTSATSSSSSTTTTSTSTTSTSTTTTSTSTSTTPSAEAPTLVGPAEPAEGGGFQVRYDTGDPHGGLAAVSIPQGQITIPGCSELGSSVTCELTERSGQLRVVPAPGSLGDVTIVITNPGGLKSTFTVEAPRLAGPQEPVGSGGFIMAYDARHPLPSRLSVSIAPGQVLAPACSSLPAQSVSCQIPGGSGTFQVIPLAPVSSVVTITLTNGLGLTTSVPITAPPATGPTLTGPARVIPVLPFTVGYDTGDAIGGSIEVSIDAPTAGTELVWVPRCSALPARSVTCQLSQTSGELEMYPLTQAAATVTVTLRNAAGTAELRIDVAQPTETASATTGSATG